MLALASALVLGQGALASDTELMTPSEHLKKLFEECADKSKQPKHIPEILNIFKAQHTEEETRALCKEIKDHRFYATAQKAGVTTIKNRAMVTWCDGTTFGRAKVGQIVQKVKAPEVKHETVKLKPVNLGEKEKSVEGEHHQLEEVKKVIEENLISLKKDKSLTPVKQKIVEELGEKVKEAEKSLGDAKISYDNLSEAIRIIREDLKAVFFEHFKPKAHENSTPEDYLDALNRALPKEVKGILPEDYKPQVEQAGALLRQANENHAKARKDLEIINREMLELTH